MPEVDQKRSPGGRLSRVHDNWPADSVIPLSFGRDRPRIFLTAQTPLRFNARVPKEFLLHNQETPNSLQMFSEQPHPSSSISDGLPFFGSVPRTVGSQSKLLSATPSQQFTQGAHCPPVLEKTESAISGILDPCPSQRHHSHPGSRYGSGSMSGRGNLTRPKNGVRPIFQSLQIRSQQPEQNDRPLLRELRLSPPSKGTPRSHQWDHHPWREARFRC